MTEQNKEQHDFVKLFLRAARSHQKAFEKNSSKFGVHRSQHRILMYLSRHADTITTQKDIAENFEVSAAAVAVSIKKLEEEGLISRRSDKNDNRSNIIMLTDAGMRVVSDTKSVISALDSAMLEGFEHEEIEQFAVYLARLCDNIKKYSDSV